MCYVQCNLVFIYTSLYLCTLPTAGYMEAMSQPSAALQSRVTMRHKLPLLASSSMAAALDSWPYMVFFNTVPVREDTDLICGVASRDTTRCTVISPGGMNM